MGAKDTVMSKKIYESDRAYEERVTQAKITWDIAFRAGQEAGIKEIIHYLKIRWKCYECKQEGISRHTFALPENWEEAIAISPVSGRREK